jgi:hypothetical protein
MLNMIGYPMMLGRSAMTVESSRMTPTLFYEPTLCHSLPSAMTTVETLKTTERGRNLIENKGPAWKTWERSGNVIENKGA